MVPGPPPSQTWDEEGFGSVRQFQEARAILEAVASRTHDERARGGRSHTQRRENETRCRFQDWLNGLRAEVWDTLCARHEYEYCDVCVNRSDDSMLYVCFQVSQRLTSDPTTQSS